jgi:hypothetical protein
VLFHIIVFRVVRANGVVDKAPREREKGKREREREGEKETQAQTKILQTHFCNQRGFRVSTEFYASSPLAFLILSLSLSLFLQRESIRVFFLSEKTTQKPQPETETKVTGSKKKVITGPSHPPQDGIITSLQILFCCIIAFSSRYKVRASASFACLVRCCFREKK